MAMETRRRELEMFYTIHDPSKLGVVDTLLTNFDFVEVVRSLKEKYGSVPPTWEAALSPNYKRVKIEPHTAPNKPVGPPLPQYGGRGPSKAVPIPSTQLQMKLYEGAPPSVQSKPELDIDSSSSRSQYGQRVHGGCVYGPPSSHGILEPDACTRDRLLRTFYSRVNPEKLSAVNTLVSQRAMTWRKLCSSMYIRYGESPDPNIRFTPRDAPGNDHGHSQQYCIADGVVSRQEYDLFKKQLPVHTTQNPSRAEMTDKPPRVVEGKSSDITYEGGGNSSDRDAASASKGGCGCMGCCTASKSKAKA